MIPQDSLYHDVNGLITWILSLLVLIIVILLFFVLHFANSLTEPIKDLSAAMDTASQGVFDLRVPVKSSDEIGLLTAHFNDMLGEINSLIDNVYKQEILKKEAYRSYDRYTYMMKQFREQDQDEQYSRLKKLRVVLKQGLRAADDYMNFHKIKEITREGIQLKLLR